MSFYLAIASAAVILVSIAASQILLALSLVALFAGGGPIRFPPFRLPLALFFVITVAAALASGDPLGAMPQIKKFFVFAIVLVIYSTFEGMLQVRALVIAWAAVASLSAAVGIAQFVHRWQEALREQANNYDFFLYGRITGFASHWMTFGGEEMIALLMLASFLLFSNQRKFNVFGWPMLALLLAAVTLGMTRSVFLLGVPLGLGYLLWSRRRVLLIAAVAVGAIGIAASPRAIQERAVSAVQPHGEDSNAHRAVCRIAGWEMVRAHPWLGLGPEQVGKQFNRYVPASVARPSPAGWYGHLHNIYLQYAAERGIFGLLAVLWLIAKVMRDFIVFLRNGAPGLEVRAILHGAIAVILSVLAEGFFEYNLGDSEVLTLFLSVIACGYVAIRQAATPAAVPVTIANAAQKDLLCGSRTTGF
jgi:O-antigen ligase